MIVNAGERPCKVRGPYYAYIDRRTGPAAGTSEPPFSVSRLPVKGPLGVPMTQRSSHHYPLALARTGSPGLLRFRGMNGSPRLLLPGPARHRMPCLVDAVIQCRIVGLKPPQQPVKAWAVTHVSRMTQFMEQHATHQFGFEKQQQVVQTQRAGRGIAAPARSLPTNREFLVTEAVTRRELFGPGLEQAPGTASQPSAEHPLLRFGFLIRRRHAKVVPGLDDSRVSLVGLLVCDCPLPIERSQANGCR